MTLDAVDRLTVRVLVDNATDVLSSTPASVVTEGQELLHRGRRLGSSRNLCCAVHGLSLLVTARRGERVHTVLFDTGPEEYAFERNAARTAAPIASVEEIVLSHGHWDHCGAVLAALGTAHGASGRRIPVHTHPDMFRTRALTLGSGELAVLDDVPSRQDLEAGGADVVCTRAPLDLLDGTFHLSGEIPRVTGFEPGLPGQVRLTADGTWEPDERVADERWLAARVAGKGLVVLTACSHAGIVNVLEHARATFPGVPVHAVVGGLHLSGAAERHIPATVGRLRAFGLSSIAPGHCTGWRAVGALAAAFGDSVVAPTAVGRTHHY